MKTYLRNILKRCLFLLVSCFLVLGNGFSGESSAQAAVNGVLRQIGNQQVLSLWGSNYDMGYAHGYLMADKIRDLVDTYVVGVMAKGDVSDYSYHLSLIPLYHTFHPEYLDEINGMVAGMIASGKSLYVSRLNRNIDNRDIQAFNLFVQYSFGCSSFGVWGSSTANGETVLARNYDFYYDPQGNILNDQILITYEPIGKPKFVSSAWPGWYGVATGINEYGITAMANAGNGESSSSNGKFYPSIEVFRKILENTTTNSYSTKPLSIVNSVSEYIPLIIQIGAPYLNSGDPVYYVEDSSALNIIRNAADTDPAYDHIIATNHFMKVSPTPSSGDTVTRYNTLRNGLINLYGSGDHKVDSAEAWSLLGSVDDIVAPTLTSIVVRPNRMEFDVSFARMVNGVFKSAAQITPQTYNWATLFPSESLPDLIVQSITPVPASPATGQPVDVTVTVKNQGNFDSGGFTVDFYKNLSVAPPPLQLGDEYCLKSGLAAGATGSCTITVTYAAAGGYNMWAQIDAGKQVTELNEANNVFGPRTVVVATTTVTDTTAPTTSITSPSANVTVSGNVNIAASAADNIGVSKVEFYINGSLKGADSTTPYSYSWTTKSFANGSYSITTKAYDAAGNVGQSAAINVTVKNTVSDTIAPMVTITSPADSAVVRGTVIIAASATDNLGVSKVEFYVNGLLKGTDTTASYSYSWNTLSVVNGSYSITAKAHDAAGNVKQSTVVRVTVKNTVVDTIAPTVSITSPVANSTISGTACAAVSVSDNVGVTKVEYYVNGMLDKVVTAAPFGYCVATTGAYNGSYTMFAKAYDAAGNVRQSTSVRYTIKN